GARHARFRPCRAAKGFRSRGVPLRSSGRLPPIPPEPPSLLASRRGAQQWKESQPASVGLVSIAYFVVIIEAHAPSFYARTDDGVSCPPELLYWLPPGVF